MTSQKTKLGIIKQAKECESAFLSAQMKTVVLEDNLKQLHKEKWDKGFCYIVFHKDRGLRIHEKTNEGKSEEKTVETFLEEIDKEIHEFEVRNSLPFGDDVIQ